MNSFDLLFKHIYKGDTKAVHLSYLILQVVHAWDDIIDADLHYTDQDVHNAFMIAMTEIPLHALWGPDMIMLFKHVYYDWIAANALEAVPNQSDNNLAKAWMLRSNIYSMFIAIADKLYGRTWAEQISVDVRLYYGETLEEFLKEVKNA